MLTLGDVNARADVTEKYASRLKARHPMIQDPAIFTVPSPQAIFHRKLLPRVKGITVDFKTAFEIVAMSATEVVSSSEMFFPNAKFLFQRTAGKVKPAIVKIVAAFIRPRHPDHHRRRISHDAKALLALAQRSFRPLALGNVQHDTHSAHTARFADRFASRHDPALLAIGKNNAKLALKRYSRQLRALDGVYDSRTVVRMNGGEEIVKYEGLVLAEAK